MISLPKLEAYLQKTLGNAPIFDKAANDLQIKGKENIKKIILGVSANLELFKKAVTKKADAIIVHHGLWLNDLNQTIPTYLQKRLQILFDNQISLFSYHYLLDSHPEIGNAISILKKLAAKNFTKFGHFQDKHWGFSGEFAKATELNKIIIQCENLFQNNLHTYSFGPKTIKSIGVTTGSGCFSLPEAHEKGIELLITGEIKEAIPHLCKELKMNLIAVGHYESEKYGIQALGDLIKKKFDVEVEFVEV
jgi:dinuclear metal center YbgI/SA1388 family protein